MSGEMKHVESAKNPLHFLPIPSCTFQTLCAVPIRVREGVGVLLGLLFSRMKGSNNDGIGHKPGQFMCDFAPGIEGPSAREIIEVHLLKTHRHISLDVIDSGKVALKEPEGAPHMEGTRDNCDGHIAHQVTYKPGILVSIAGPVFHNDVALRYSPGEEHLFIRSPSGMPLLTTPPVTTIFRC